MAVRPLNAAARARLKRDFEAIPERMRAKARAVCQASANEMVRQMQVAVPVDSGKLKESIRVEDVSTESWIRFRVKVGGPLTTVKARKGVRDRHSAEGKGVIDYAILVEYGHLTAHSSTRASKLGRGGFSSQVWVPPQPFFRPTRARVAKKHRVTMRNALKKAAQDG
jgi:HK97 gp10 family phage protein